MITKGRTGKMDFNEASFGFFMQIVWVHSAWRYFKNVEPHMAEAAFCEGVLFGSGVEV